MVLEPLGALAMNHPDILIIGGGIIGLACALRLTREGLSVEILEKGEPARGATWAAAGMLAPLTEAADGGPFFEACRQARDAWPSWIDEITGRKGRAIELDTSGTLVVAFSEDELEVVEELTHAARRLGEPVEEIDAAEAYRLVPDLAPEMKRAILLAGEHRVDNRAVARALTAAVEREGVQIRRYSAVDHLELRGDAVCVVGDSWRREADRILLTAGAWSARVGGVGFLPIRPVRGQILRIDGVQWSWDGVVRCGELYAVRRGADALLVGATVEEVGYSDHATSAGLAELARFVDHAFPSLSGRRVGDLWSGLRPGTPDGRPILDEMLDGRILLAVGHYRNGILLAPWTAEKVADRLLGRTPSLPSEFSLGRFQAIRD